MGRPTPDHLIPPPTLPPSYAPTATPPWNPPPPPLPSSDQSGWFILFLIVSFVVSLLVFFVCGVTERHREDRRRAEAAAAAAAAPVPPRLEPTRHFGELPWLEPTRHFQELRLRQARAANPVARRLPAFKYDRSVKHNVTGGGEEAATCPVCLGAFQLGESVRLLPLCLHLYHAECIDLWLDAHSTCPICRSDTVPAMDVARIPHG